jgi:hypothetical protein
LRAGPRLRTSLCPCAIHPTPTIQNTRQPRHPSNPIPPHRTQAPSPHPLLVGMQRARRTPACPAAPGRPCRRLHAPMHLLIRSAGPATRRTLPLTHCHPLPTLSSVKPFCSCTLSRQRLIISLSQSQASPPLSLPLFSQAPISIPPAGVQQRREAVRSGALPALLPSTGPIPN